MGHAVNKKLLRSTANSSVRVCISSVIELSLFSS
jgi:hypothetical protein